jgi:hypothetical protein
MPPKATPTTATASGSVEDTSMADTDSQVVTMGQLQTIVDQLTGNGQALENKIAEIGMSKIKMPSIERFSGEKAKLKGFLTQMKLKIRHEGAKLPLVADQVAYAGLFLTGRALEWFEPYLTEYEANGLTTGNNEVKYMFSSWEGFCNRLTQMYGDPEAIATAERKLQELTQRGSAMDYTTQFQTYATQTEWNDKALMAWYRQGLKAEVQNAMISMEDPEDMRELIEQAIKVDNRIYQSKRARRELNRLL